MKTLQAFLVLCLFSITGCVSYTASQQVSEDPDDSIEEQMILGYKWPSTTERYESLSAVYAVIKKRQLPTSVIWLLQDEGRESIQLENSWARENLRSPVPMFLINTVELNADEVSAVNKELGAESWRVLPSCVLLSKEKVLGYAVGGGACTGAIMSLKEVDGLEPVGSAESAVSAEQRVAADIGGYRWPSDGSWFGSVLETYELIADEKILMAVVFLLQPGSAHAEELRKRWEERLLPVQVLVVDSGRTSQSQIMTVRQELDPKKERPWLPTPVCILIQAGNVIGFTTGVAGCSDAIASLAATPAGK